MGTDIHAGIEYFDGGKWKAHIVPNPWYEEENKNKRLDEDDVPEPEFTAGLDIDRDYYLFGILARLRRETPFILSEERGRPADVSQEVAQTALTGDHTDTWVTLHEILQFDWSEQECAYAKLQSYMEITSRFWLTVMPIMIQYGVNHGPENVRLVMNFDS
jgi:hypothetical protein